MIPTVGKERERLLIECLESIEANSTRPDEILVIDQSESLSHLASDSVRVVASPSTGVPGALNHGLAESSSRYTFVTHDDCTVAEDWVEQGLRLIDHRDAILTGTVRPGAGGSGDVPSTIEDPDPVVYTGDVRHNVIYPCNMVVPTIEARSFGFDPIFERAAEDNDLCYRWLKAGRALEYRPEMVVWHQDWRTHEQMRALEKRYWHGAGLFYYKHLRLGDTDVLGFMRRETDEAATVSQRDDHSEECARAFGMGVAGMTFEETLHALERLSE